MVANCGTGGKRARDKAPGLGRGASVPAPYRAEDRGRPSPSGVLALQRLAGNAAVVQALRHASPITQDGPAASQSATLRRYFLGHATAATSPTALSAQVKQVDGSFRDPTDLTHTDVAIAGTDPTTAPVGVAPEPLRISEDGKMAIENTDLSNRQAKVFFAQKSVVKDANNKLAKVGSKYLLQVSAAAAMTVDDEKGKSHTLDEIEPVVNPEARNKKNFKEVAPNLGTQEHGNDTPVAATCNAVAEAILGHSGVPSNDRLSAFKLLTPGDQGQWPTGIADAMTKGGKRKEAVLDNTAIAAIAKAYAALVQNNPVQAAKMAKKLKVNEFAEAKVGQAYATESIGVTAGVGEVQNWDPLNDPGTSNQKLKVDDAGNRSGKRRIAWGNHIGAVVAASKGNTVTFENYARDAEEGSLVDSDKLGYFAMYGPVTKPNQTWHGVWSQGAVPVKNALTTVV